MNKLKEQLKHKYAYNINDSSKGKKVTVSSGKDFLQLRGGFYDDIENNDISIKLKQKQLQKIKNESLKEFVFTNKLIPHKWKKKLNYQNDVIKILAKDNDFLLYVSRGSNPSMAETISTGSNTSNISRNYKTIKKGLTTSYSQMFPKINNRFLSEEKQKIKNDINRNININVNVNKTMDEDFSNNEKTFSASKSPYPKLKPENKNDIMSDKDITNLLEEFRTAYPIKLSKEDQNEQEYVHGHGDSLDTKSNKNNIPKSDLLFYNTFMQINRNINPFANIHNMKLDKRQRIFRQNIFNNLIPPKDNKILKSNSMVNLDPSNKFKKMKIKKEEKEHKFGPFLNLDFDSFYKKTKINNPVIQKNLEFINFYGPYYSYCPPCLNRNLEFYNNLEPNQCLKLIQYIKKIRGKKNIINLKEKKQATNERKSEKKTSSLDEDIKIENENENDNDMVLEKVESVEFSQ